MIARFEEMQTSEGGVQLGGIEFGDGFERAVEGEEELCYNLWLAWYSFERKTSKEVCSWIKMEVRDTYLLNPHSQDLVRRS